MPLVSAILFALCANIDNLPIGAAYELKKMPIPLSYNFSISLLIALGTLLCMKAGAQLIVFFPSYAIDQLACGLLIFMGLLFLLHGWCDPASQNLPDPKPINLHQCLFLSLTLLFNNAAVGLSASLAGGPVLLTALFTFFASSFFLWLGAWIARRFQSLFPKRLLNRSSGMIMILLGLWEWWI